MAPATSSEAAHRRRRPLPSPLARVSALRPVNPCRDGKPSARTVETHFSWLVLTDDCVYKLKKPIRSNGVDHRSLASRRRDCRRELRLNRRLATDVYLDVLPLRQARDGRLALGGPGRCMDWVLRMRRLPDELTLELALRAHRATRADAEAIAAVLARFFASLSPVRIGGATYRRLLRQSVDEAARRLGLRAYGLPTTAIRPLRDALRAALEHHRDDIDARVLAGCVVDGHGDLRPEHIYLTRPPLIIDALEFDRRLRCRDRLDELAFLTLECERAGQPEFGAWLLDAYRRLSGDRWPPPLLPLYQARHAFNRARIAIWHLDEHGVGSRRHWQGEARRYLVLAERALARMRDCYGVSVPATRTPSRTRSPG